MKLNEAILLETGKKVKIGSGSGFVFIDTITNDTPKIIKDISDDYYKRQKKYYKDLKTFYSNIDARWSERRRKAEDEWFKKAARHEAQKPLHKLVEDLEKEKEAERTKTEKALRETRLRIENYVDFGERNVKEVYDSIYADKIIIFEGNETGDFWLESEYREGKRDGDTEESD